MHFLKCTCTIIYDLCVTLKRTVVGGVCVCIRVHRSVQSKYRIARGKTFVDRLSKHYFRVEGAYCSDVNTHYNLWVKNFRGRGFMREK